MITKIKQILKNKKGIIYIEVLLSVLVVTFLVVLTVNIYALITQKKSLDNIAVETARHIQIAGKVDSGCDNLFKRMVSDMPQPVTYLVNTEYINNSKQIQIGTPIEVIVVTKNKFLGIPITIKSKGVGVSEVYFKE